MKANQKKIRVAIAGFGNCASALLQVIFYCTVAGKVLEGVMHRILGGYSIADVEIVAIFDVDKNKVGKDASEAIYSGPNCTEKICDIPFLGVKVSMGPILDGVAPHMKDSFSPAKQKFLTKEEWKKQVVAILRESKAEILLNYMPVGSDLATAFYAECALEAGCAFINCMPSFICSIPAWAARFTKAGLPIIGDDIKSQIGASILNRWIAHLFDLRGSKINLIYQHNRGNNTDFANMQDTGRLKSKFISKRQTVTSNIEQTPEFDLKCNGFDSLVEGDHKICDLKFRSIICGTQLTFDGTLEVVDSYNSAGVVIDAIRVARLALDRKIAGPVIPACAFFMKSPPVQMEDGEASRLMEDWIADGSRTIVVSHSRIKDFCQSGQKFSEVWTRICKDIVENAYRHGVKGIKVLSPKRFYHDEKEVVALILEAIQQLLEYPDGYEKTLIIPFSLTDKGLKKKLIDILRNAAGIKIYGINVPPDEEYLSQIPNICGYAGLDEFAVGQELYTELVSRVEVSKVLVIRHQKNEGLEMRIDGIKDAAQNKKEVIVLGAHEHRQIKNVIASKNVGVITLGCRGTEAILGLKMVESIPLVCMDINERIETSLKGVNVKLMTSFVHEHLYGGIIFSGVVNVNLSPEKTAV